MNPLNPWVDTAEVRRLAERLLAPATQPSPAIRDAGFDAGFIGYASGTITASPPLPPEPPARPPAPLVERTIEATPEIASAASPFQPLQETRKVVRGPFLDRISRFRNWFASEYSASGIFILDREGAVIFDESGNEKLQSLARNLALASRKPGNPPSNIRLKIGTRATLEVIPVDTAYGYLVLAGIVPDTLSPQAILAVMDALSKAAAPPPR